MAKSRLYLNATAALGARQADWARAEAHLSTVAGPDPDRPNEDGAAVVAMIQTENHLSEDLKKAAPKPMSELLADLASAPWNSDPAEVRDTYNQIVGKHVLRGKPIDHSPDQHLRYINGPDMLAKWIPDALAKAGATAIANALRMLIDDAEHGTGGTTWRDVLDDVQDAAVWSSLPGDQVSLTRPANASMFVTFDDPKAPMNRDSAGEVHAALALRLPRHGDCFLEATLPTAGTDQLRIPTFADAGWSCFFRSAPPDAPCGRTQPHWHPANPPAQPEAVREPGTLAELQSSSDLRILPM